MTSVLPAQHSREYLSARPPALLMPYTLLSSRMIYRAGIGSSPAAFADSGSDTALIESAVDATRTHDSNFFPNLIPVTLPF
jgi:hypothetical protein